jgi:hypothetical protein
VRQHKISNEERGQEGERVETLRTLRRFMLPRASGYLRRYITNKEEIQGSLPSGYLR